MATYDTPIFTNQSSKLVSSVAANSEQLTFTKIVYSSDDFSNKTDDDIANLTDLTNKEITAQAQSFPENGITKVRGAGNNDNLNQGLNIKTFGVYAKGNNIPEMLVAIATSQNADYLDTHNNNASNQLTYTFNFKISNTSNIIFSNIHDISVTQSDLQSAIARIDFSGAVKQANNYTDEQLKGYQPTGDYATTGSVSQQIIQVDAKAQGYASSASNNVLNNLTRQINAMYQQRGDWFGPLNDWGDKQDGIYTIHNQHDGNIPDSFTGFGIIDIKTGNDGLDKYGIVHDNQNHMFRTHLFVDKGYFSGWVQY